MEAVTALKVAADVLCKFLGSDFVIKELYSIWENDKEIELLAETVQHIRNVLFDVQRRQIEDRSVTEWYQRLRALFLDAEDFLDKVQTLKKKKDAEASRIKEAEEEIVKPDGKGKRSLAYCRVKMEPLKNTARRFFSSSSNQAKYALEVHNAIKEIKRNLDAITRNIQSIPLLGNEPISRSERALTANRARTCIVHASEIIGRDGDKDKVVELLLRPFVDEREISVVSIVGMSGMGKTTVAQLVYDDKSWQKKCQFDKRFWVSDSKKYGLESLSKHILKSVDPNNTCLDNLTLDHLSDQFVNLIQGKSFLLVLDDVDCEDRSEWEDLMKLLKKGKKDKSRVLVTTRSRKVAGVVGSLSDSTYKLEGLSRKDSLELFERYASPKRRDGILDEIVKKCCGVPLALKVIGSLLREADAVEWENVRKCTSLANIVDERDETNKLISILKISYDDLDPTTKQCFSFCALFPKNYIIPKEILSSIWMDNIHFKINEGETLESVCDKKLRFLYNRCFLEAENMNREPFDEFGEATHVKMHDLMCDLARKVAGEEILVVDVDLKGDNFIVEEKVRHLLFDSKITGTFQLKGNGKRLRSILTCFQGRKMELSWILSECSALRMLDIDSYGNDHLPSSVGGLIRLRYLCLSYNDFQTIPDSICELINLKHLHLNHCRALTQLPSRMGALASLQVLSIKYCKELEELPSSIVNLVNLHQLFLVRCESLSNLPFRMDALTSLRLLCIVKYWRFELQSCIGNMVNLRHLDIHGECSYPLPFGLGALTSLELLSLDCDNGVELPRGIEKLNNLRKLSLNGCRNLARMPSGMGALLSICRPALFVVGDPDSSYAQLEELLPLSNFPADLKIRIFKNYKLKTPIGDGEPFLSNKKSLRKLGIIFDHYGSDYMIQYEIDGWAPLVIDGWNETEEVIWYRDILEKLKPPPNLEEFSLCGYQCTMFPPSVRQHDFASALENLVDLSLSNCDKVRYLPFMRTLNSLKRLGLYILHSLEYIEENISATVFCLPRLKSLSLMDLPKFRGWCGGLPDGVNEDDSELIQLMRPPSFPCLSDVKIRNCSSFREPFHLLLSLNISDFKNGSRFSCDIISYHDEEKLNSLCLQKTNDSLELSIDARRVTPRYMVETFRAMSGHLACLNLFVWLKFKTLPGLQHLSALRVLKIRSCSDFTWEEEEEEEEEQKQSVRDDEIQSTSLHTAHHRHVSWTGLTSLESLTLDNLRRMVRLPEGIQFLPSLKKLHICYCENLQIPEWLQETFECREEVKEWETHFLWVKKETDATGPPPPL